MTRLLAIVVAAAACARAPVGTPGPAPIASGTFHNAAGERVGVAALTDTVGEVRLAVSVGGLTPGLHGIHLHTTGNCTPPDFASAGSHLDPRGRKHGRLNPDGPHLGDLPNLVVGADGSADTSFVVGDGADTLSGAELAAAAPSVVIHAGTDDERTDPSGNSGDRAACAVLEAR